MEILTRETAQAAHAKQAFCRICSAPTTLRFTDDFFFKAGVDPVSGDRIRGLEAACSAHREHAPALLTWARLDALSTPIG